MARFLVVFTLVVRCLLISADDGLLSNGNFETPPANGFASNGVEGTDVLIPGWQTNGTVELIQSGQRQGGMILIVPEGSHAVRLGNDAEIRQPLTLEKGSSYAVTFSAARTCAQFESLNISIPSVSSQNIDLQTLYSVHGWDSYSWGFIADSASGYVSFRNPGMEDDPTCGPILDNIAIKQIATPDKQKGNAVINGDFEEGPWMFRNVSLGVLLPNNLDAETSALPGWTVESNRAVRYIDSYHYSVPEGKRAVELLSGKEGIISQMVETSPEKRYTLTFLVGTAGDSCQQPLAVTAFAGDQATNVHYAPTGNLTYQSANISFIARAERTRIAFYSVYYNIRTDDHSSLCGPVLDDVRMWEATGAAAAQQGVRFLLVGLMVYTILSLCFEV
ncbi:uncharacterized protein LOC116264185 [Nymphaea colorata]|nr:uncharacterized protein LOC116264185 [Nymphaea colorata]